jgi:hypothetical protein
VTYSRQPPTLAAAGLALALACGARTGLDVVQDCDTPARCLPGVSYAYRAGVNIAKLNDVFVPAN